MNINPDLNAGKDLLLLDWPDTVELWKPNQRKSDHYTTDEMKTEMKLFRNVIVK